MNTSVPIQRQMQPISSDEQMITPEIERKDFDATIQDASEKVSQTLENTRLAIQKGSIEMMDKLKGFMNMSGGNVRKSIRNARVLKKRKNRSRRARMMARKSKRRVIKKSSHKKRFTKRIR